MASESGPFLAALASLAWIAALALLTWGASLARRDASLIDRVWPVFIAGAALVDFVCLPASGTRGPIILALTLAWGLRLCVHITRRNWGHPEDRRYRQIRARNQPNFGIKSLFLIFGLQTVLAWVVSAPILAGMAGTRPLGLLDAAGLIVTAFGIAFEAISDAQLASFRADPAHAGEVLERGLWRYSRHPNYFGEACVWWGLWLLALGGAGVAGVWSAVSPLLMTVLLIKVSGVALLEKDISEGRPAYRDYVVRTRAFVPGPPRRTTPPAPRRTDGSA
jgi:steroid 5-alpha reductase family enzyme